MKFGVAGNPTVTPSNHCRSNLAKLCLETKTSFRQGVKAAPKEAIGRNHGCRHDDGGSEKEIEVAAVAGLADGCSQPDRRVDPTLEMEVFGNDAGVPSATGSGNQSGDQVRKDSREDQLSPAGQTVESKDGAAFLQVRRDGDCAGDNVKQDVPLRA